VDTNISVKICVWLEPVNTVSCAVPLGDASLENVVDPPDASKSDPPDETCMPSQFSTSRSCNRRRLTAEKVDDTPLPHESVPPETPHEPLLDVIVKLDAVPLSVYVPGVCTDNVAPDSRPPSVVPEDVMALIVALAGSVPVVVGLGDCRAGEL
jgi:hypothetical protein